MSLWNSVEYQLISFDAIGPFDDKSVGLGGIFNVIWHYCWNIQWQIIRCQWYTQWYSNMPVKVYWIPF